MTTTGKTTRRERRRRREAAHWDARYAAANGDPAALATVEWDRLRKVIRALPVSDQPKAWEDVVDALDQLLAKISGK